ncbi:MAG: hypothetical protein ACE5JG_02340 [Planctomycetota bacterium]
MIILMKRDAAPDAVRAMVERVRALGLEVTSLDEAKGHAFEVTGSGRGRVLALRDEAGVAEILTRRTRLEGGEPLWPHFALRLAAFALLLLAALALLTAFLPRGLGDRADPAAAAEPARLEWHLRPLAAFLDLFPGGSAPLGGLMVLVLWVLFLLWPLVDRADEGTARGRRAVRLIRAMGVALVLLVLALWLQG